MEDGRPHTSAEVDLRPQPVTVMAHGESKSDAQAWSQEIFLSRDAILTLSATAVGSCDASKLPPPPPPQQLPATVNAGVTLKLTVNGTQVAADRCFEGETATVRFFASASHSCWIRKGKHTLGAFRTDDNITHDQRLEVTFHTVWAETLTPE